MKRHFIMPLLACTLGFAGCTGQAEKEIVNADIAYVKDQISRQIDNIEASGEVKIPGASRESGHVGYLQLHDWRCGFFPGMVWYLYELTRDEALLPVARKYTEHLAPVQFHTNHHDVGFIIECSYGNGLRLTHDSSYEDVIVQTARSLSTRFRPAAGVIQSWDIAGWQAERGWKCPVIIDNMMNLELLFNATRISGDSTFYKIAVSHADRTLEEHFRPDGSCYHVIDYDPETGIVRNRHTAQGYAHESAWSRGQAWAIYGYTVCYRITGDRRYLDQAVKTFEFMKNHPNVAEDLIPYWDMDAPNIPDEPRDASSASIIASALYELCGYVDSGHAYKEYADRLMTSLATPDYRPEPGTYGNFLLKRSTGSRPHNGEVEVPIIYADYYYIEAIRRRASLLDMLKN